jgi:hypothetical protein
MLEMRLPEGPRTLGAGISTVPHWEPVKPSSHTHADMVITLVMVGSLELSVLCSFAGGAVHTEPR